MYPCPGTRKAIYRCNFILDFPLVMCLIRQVSLLCFSAVTLCLTLLWLHVLQPTRLPLEEYICYITFFNHHIFWEKLNCQVQGISQARILEWVAIAFSRSSQQHRDQTHMSCVGRRIHYHWATREAQVVCYCHLKLGCLVSGSAHPTIKQDIVRFQNLMKCLRWNLYSLFHFYFAWRTRNQILL